MHIGFTYDLRDDYLAEGFSEEQAAEFDRPDTIACIADTLEQLGHEVTRIGKLPSLMTRLLQGERWDLVFNIAEGNKGLGREAQVPALLDAWGIPYVFSDPMVMGLCLHKAMAKRVVRDAGVATPDFALVAGPGDVHGIRVPFPLFAKPVAEGTSKGVGPTSRIDNAMQLERVCRDLLRRFEQPVLVERYLPGREFTVGLLGCGRQARVLGVLDVQLTAMAEPDIYTWVNKEEYDTHAEYVLAQDAGSDAAARLALTAWRALGCRDGGRVDIRVDEYEQPQFMEVNPLPGLNPQRSDLAILNRLCGRSYKQLIADILDSALSRTPAGAPSTRERSRQDAAPTRIMIPAGGRLHEPGQTASKAIRA